jgi:hypothetical protein
LITEVRYLGQLQEAIAAVEAADADPDQHDHQFKTLMIIN